jgi:histidinol-phosphate aminotransferase
MNITDLIRENIKALKPYSSARDEYQGSAEIFLDANESPYPTEFNRYPDPTQAKVKTMLANLKGVESDQLFLGNGSDEPIDLLIRVFCEPGEDSILLAEPTYGMYSVCAQINNVNIQSVPLTDSFDIDVPTLLGAVNESTKIIFLCSPNNPTGNLFDKSKIIEILRRFNGLVVIDEAYIDFTDSLSFIKRIGEFNNLVVLQTLSKAWGLAGLRAGMCIANKPIIEYLNKVKYPYNISSSTQSILLKELTNEDVKNAHVKEIVCERGQLMANLSMHPEVIQVFPSEANFILVKFNDSSIVYSKLLDKRIIVRNRSNVVLCGNCLRISIGTPEENKALIKALNEL